MVLFIWTKQLGEKFSIWSGIEREGELRTKTKIGEIYKMILISACLVGIDCRYNGEGNLVPELKKLVEKGMAIPVCPEQLGGLTTPREPCEITVEADNQKEQKVITQDGQDVTFNFKKGAEETLKIAQMADVTCALFKERSPSCGSNKIYNGKFEGKLIPGQGLATQILKKSGISVFSEEDMNAFYEYIR